MRSMDPYKIWLLPQRDSQSHNAPPSTLSHRISIIGGGK
jgi:hypothetical protein